MGRGTRAATRRPDEISRSPAVAFASVALAVQGLVWFFAGSRFLAQAGRLEDSTVAGFAGLLGLLLAVPGAVGITAGIGVWCGWRRAAWVGRAAAALCIAVATAAIAGAVAATNPGGLLLAVFLGVVNVGVFRSLRPGSRRGR